MIGTIYILTHNVKILGAAYRLIALLCFASCRRFIIVGQCRLNVLRLTIVYSCFLQALLFLLFLFGDFFLALFKSVIGFSHSNFLLYNSTIGAIRIQHFPTNCAFHSNYNILVVRGHGVDGGRSSQTHNSEINENSRLVITFQAGIFSPLSRIHFLAWSNS